MPQSEEPYADKIKAGLEAALLRAGTRPTEVLDVQADRWVIFSDQHKGVRNGADDFKNSERAYNAALGYYYEMGYRLVVLGDAEELWEEQPARVVKSYSKTLNLEAEFHAAGRYLRVYGNHDDEWGWPQSVKQHLEPFFGSTPPRIEESFRVRVDSAGDHLGMMFLIHGHQGTGGSDRWRNIARIPVRYLWRPLQRLTGLSLNTPARDWKLGGRHNRAMHEWAADKPGFLLVAGHTHHPVFESKLHSVTLEGRLAEKRAEYSARPDVAALQSEVAQLRARLEWSRSRSLESPDRLQAPGPTRPAYFNAGCCCYADGDITGIELAGGEIRLVRWPDDDGAPKPRVLSAADLRGVFEACK